MIKLYLIKTADKPFYKIGHSKNPIKRCEKISKLEHYNMPNKSMKL